MIPIFRTLPRSFWLIVVYFTFATGMIFTLLPDWGNDDPYITYRYAENLSAGRGFVYNPGEHILSTTSPLFALILAGVRRFTDDLPRAANLIGAMSLAAGALLLWDLARQWGEPRAGWAALALYPTTELLVRTLGSETPLYLALCLGAMVLYGREKHTLAGILLALAFLTRGDAAVLGAILAVDWLIKTLPRTGPDVRAGFRALPWRGMAAGTVILAGWALFAVPYFGSALPVTLAVKRAQGLMQISEKFAPGFWVILQPYFQHIYFKLEMVFMAIGLCAVFRRKAWWVLPGWMGLYFLGYALLGVTRYFWYYAPLVPGAVGLIGVGLATVARFPARSRGGERMLSGGMILLLTGFAVLQLFHLSKMRLYPDERLVAYRRVGEWLAQNTPPDTQIGALEVGVIGYYAAPRPMVDFAGLIQPEVARLFAPQITYQDTAFWAVATYRPEMIVLPDGGFPTLENALITNGRCTVVHHFPGTETGYSQNLSIYQCPYP